MEDKTIAITARHLRTLYASSVSSRLDAQCARARPEKIPLLVMHQCRQHLLFLTSNTSGNWAVVVRPSWHQITQFISIQASFLPALIFFSSSTGSWELRDGVFTYFLHKFIESRQANNPGNGFCDLTKETAKVNDGVIFFLQELKDMKSR